MSDRLVFRDDAGRELTLGDLAGATGVYRWEVIGSENVPAEAEHLHHQARDAGTRGDYDQAIELLDRAHALAPGWPYPRYDAAYTHLLRDDPTRAEELYAEVDRLAPRGFFTSKRSLDILRRERTGSIPPGFSKAFAQLEWIPDKDDRRNILRGIVNSLPGFAPAWHELSRLLVDPDERLRAIESGLAAEPDSETLGIMLINKALILHTRGQDDDAVAILGSLALDPDSTLATEALSKAVLAEWLNAK